MSEALQIIAIPLLLAWLLIGIHTYLGLHVLARKIIFIDLALAQIAALGATLAFILGHAPQSTAAYGYSLAFTLISAAVLSLSRAWIGGRIPQEAIVGVIYVVSAAAAILLIDQAPQGAEHLKQILTGNLLTATTADLWSLTGVYAVIGAVLFASRRHLVALSFGQSTAPQHWSTRAWDFLFYALFGVVVTSSVAVAGVLLVFTFLIIPAAIGMLYSTRIAAILLIGWATGLLASVLGMALSYRWNLPTGASLVCTFGLTLLAAALLKPLVLGNAMQRRRRLRHGLRYALHGVTTVLFVSALWLVIKPDADQPLLDFADYVYPPLQRAFINDVEHDQYQQSQRAEQHAYQEALRLNQKERDSRWQGEALSDDEVRRIASYAQSFLEMRKGEQIVQRAIRNKARLRQRWILGVPLLMFCAALWLWLSSRRPPHPPALSRTNL